MKVFLLAGILGLGIGASAADGEFKMPSKCIMSANQMLMDYSFGFDPDGVSLYLDGEGKVVVPNSDKIVKRSIDKGVETITYKTRQAKGGGYYAGEKVEYETVEKTVSITRNSEGKITGVAKQFDTASQVKRNTDFEKSGYKGLPIVKSLESEFNYKGDDCSLNQTMGLEADSEKSKAEKKVYFDRAFCEKLAPIVKQIGQQNAAQCAGFINQAQVAFDMRNGELAKEGKAFKMYDYFGNQGAKAKNNQINFDLGAAIQSCVMADTMFGGFSGMPYGGGMMGLPYGGGMMGMPGGGMMGGPSQPKGGEKAVDTQTGKGVK